MLAVKFFRTSQTMFFTHPHRHSDGKIGLDILMLRFKAGVAFLGYWSLSHCAVATVRVCR